MFQVVRGVYKCVSESTTISQVGFPATVGIDRHHAHLPAALLGDVGEELGGVDVEAHTFRQVETSLVEHEVIVDFAGSR